MKTFLGIFIPLTLLFTHAGAPQKSPFPAEELISMAKEFVASLEKGDYEASVKDFDETMTKLVSPDKMKQVWETVLKQVGKLKQRKGIRTESIPNYDIVYVP